MKVKICGLKTLEDIDYINEALPDFAGFIFAESSRRVSFKKNKKMKSKLNKNIKSIGVFVNEKTEKIINAAEEGIIDLIQLHGNEDNNYIKEIGNKLKLPVIKAFKADSNLKYNIENTIADYVLIDSCNKNQFGGTGQLFDWGLIPETDKKIFLAGGLNADNIIRAIKEVNPYCLDINSGVEINGKKDRKKILEVMQIVKGYKK